MCISISRRRSVSLSSVSSLFVVFVQYVCLPSKLQGCVCVCARRRHKIQLLQTDSLWRPVLNSFSYSCSCWDAVVRSPWSWEPIDKNHKLEWGNCSLVSSVEYRLVGRKLKKKKKKKTSVFNLDQQRDSHVAQTYLQTPKKKKGKNTSHDAPDAPNPLPTNISSVTLSL